MSHSEEHPTVDPYPAITSEITAILDGDIEIISPSPAVLSVQALIARAEADKTNRMQRITPIGHTRTRRFIPFTYETLVD